MFTGTYIIQYGDTKLSDMDIQGVEEMTTSNDPKYNSKCAVIRQEMRLTFNSLYWERAHRTGGWWFLGALGVSTIDGEKTTIITPPSLSSQGRFSAQFSAVAD